MTRYKTCINGHNYDEGLYGKCPYCPLKTDDINFKKTLSDFKNTRTINEATHFEKTVMDDIAGNSIDVQGNNATEHPFKKTQIVIDGKNIATVPILDQEKRKLVGWLVTFNNNQYGQDFKLFSGKNKIGTAQGCDIIVNDPSVSGEHTTIFYKEHEFLIKDDFSTNGTIVNGQSISEGKLMEGDELKLGNTTFKFKTVF